MLKRMILMVGVLMALMTTAAMAQSAATFDGKPDFSKGDEISYYVWRDGDEWHVRWTTNGTLHRFNGSVMSEGGELKSLKRIDVESESRVIAAGRAPRVVRGPRGRVVGVRGGRAPVVVNREQDKIEKDGDHRIHFLSANDGDIDGFDFKVDKNVASLKFALEIDGKPAPRRIEVGKSNAKASGVPFSVSLN
ncbi:MAG: hypothetical protein AB7P14_06500 [Blastocatellales bacterium]